MPAPEESAIAFRLGEELCSISDGTLEDWEKIIGDWDKLEDFREGWRSAQEEASK